MSKSRNRYVYLILIVLVISLGLGSRHYADYLPEWNKLYVGDGFWALMVFFIIGFLFKSKSTYWIACAAIVFSFLIEFSQLYQANWINSIRATRLGGLVLGYGFLWSDLACYSIGIAFGVTFEKFYMSFIEKKFSH